MDEIGEMPMSMQVHLLRVLEERVIRPVGSNRLTPIDVRIIAASNRNLEDEVEKGNFRQDLYYRLNVVNVMLPPLRERLDDIPALVQHFSTMLASDLGVSPPMVTGDDLFHLRDYDWPGNIRELKNIIERCILLKQSPRQCLSGNFDTTNDVQDATLGIRLDEVEKSHILKVLAMEDGNKSSAARILGVSRKTLERKVKAWNES